MANGVGALAEGGVELVLEFDHRQAAWPVGSGLPDDVQPDGAECRVGVVVVLPPACGADVDLDVALERLGVADLNECPLEVRPGLEVEKAGVQDGREASICCAEVAAAEALMLPNGLQ
ncbi:MAG: hypothetical protein VX509_08045 [Verrucomicrobiota bacterium]|nr:hypothetical protein [Verrucomicrobiota bacterium]